MHPSIRALAGAALLSFAQAGSAGAQQVSPPCAGAMAGDAAQTARILIAAGTPVEFEFVQPLSSRTSRIDEFFPIRLTKPVLSGEQVVIPAGAGGHGQIIHAAKAGGAGKAGELIVAVRCIEANGARVSLRRYRDGGIGQDLKEGALGVSMVVPFAGFLVKSGEKTIDAGSRGNAIVATDTLVAAAIE